MRILIVFDQYLSGGLETHLDACLAALSKIGVAISCLGGADFRRSPVFPLVGHYVETNLRDLSGLAIRRAASCAEAMIRSERIDVVVIHPFRWFIPAAAACLTAGVPYVPMFHGPSTPESVEFYYPEPARRALAEFVLPRAAAVMAVSEACAESITAKLHRHPCSHVIRNPVDLDRFNAPLPAGIHPVALLVSRLDGDKRAGTQGALEFLARWKELRPGWRIRIAGTGSAAEELRDWCAARSFPAEWLGRRDDVERLMEDSGLVVGMGRVILEALASRRPAVLSGCDGLVGLVTPANFAALQRQNFSGRGLAGCTAEQAVRQAGRAVESGAHPAEELRRAVAAGHDAGATAGQLRAILETAVAHAPDGDGRAAAEQVLSWAARLAKRDLLAEGWHPDSAGRILNRIRRWLPGRRD